MVPAFPYLVTIELGDGWCGDDQGFERVHRIFSVQGTLEVQENGLSTLDVSMVNGEAHITHDIRRLNSANGSNTAGSNAVSNTPPKQRIAVYDSAHPQIASPKAYIVQRSRNGMFYAPGFINGHPVTFVVDTGAAFVSINNQTAILAGIKHGKPGTAMTANGNIRTL